MPTIPTLDQVQSVRGAFEDHVRVCATCRPSADKLFIACAVGAVLLGRYVADVQSRPGIRRPQR